MEPYTNLYRARLKKAKCVYRITFVNGLGIPEEMDTRSKTYAMRHVAKAVSSGKKVTVEMVSVPVIRVLP
jgi:hypothetical protein